jgi:replication factor C subunit 2/4
MSNELDSIPWIEKYRPKKLDDMTQDKNLIELFKNGIKTGNISHFLFHGSPGTGKTSAILAMGRDIFKEFFPSRVIEFNASDDRGINAVREKITQEAKKFVAATVSKDGTKIPPYKIIILDEADSMTDEAQDALRVIIEQYSTVTRFCFICNYISKITDAIKSRCSIVYFKKLSNESIISKLNEIAIKEKMLLPENILNVIIEVSNGDMRKAIMFLQNLKYLYNFKKTVGKPYSQMSLNELKAMSTISVHSEIDPEIVESDIYEIAASIDSKKAHEIIDSALKCKSIVEVKNLCKQIVATGYPIDNILTQLNKAVLETKELTDKQKAKIITYSGKIFYKIKECANEYIQLIDYLSCINGIKKNNPAYDF